MSDQRCRFDLQFYIYCFHFKILPLAVRYCYQNIHTQSQNCTHKPIEYSFWNEFCFFGFFVSLKTLCSFFKFSVRRLLVNRTQYTYDLKIATIFHICSNGDCIEYKSVKENSNLSFARPDSIPMKCFALFTLGSLVVHSKINYCLLLIGVRVYNIFRFVAFNANEMI